MTQATPIQMAPAPTVSGPGPNPGGNRLPTPRPNGVAPGFPYEPRVPYRESSKTDFVIRAVEWFEDNPQWPNLGRLLLDIWYRMVVRERQAPVVDVPDPEGSWRFAAIGDYGAGTPQQAMVARNILRSRPELLVTTGDNVYPTGRWEDYQKNFLPEHLMGQVIRQVPIMPALGNHDLYLDDLVPYFHYFPQLQGLPYYTFTHRDAQFFALDTDQDLSPGSAQYRWLEAELARSDSRWKVVYMHYPPVSTAPNGGDDELRRWIAPLMEKYGVQLVLSGHEHSYQRSYPISGPTYVLTGGGGQITYAFRGRRQPWLARRVPAFHHTEIAVGRDQMVVRAIDKRGNLIDVATIPVTGATHAIDGVQLRIEDVGLAATRLRGARQAAAGAHAAQPA